MGKLAFGIKYQLQESTIELELLRLCNPWKKELLVNVVAEQDFRIYLNSTDANERALNSFCD